MNPFRLAIPTLATALLAAWAGPVLAAPSLVCGTVLTQSITLKQDLVCPVGFTGPALEIANHFVTVNLNGFGIIGPGGATFTRGVYNPGFDGTTIMGGSIHSFGSGILIEGGSGHTLTKLTVNAPLEQSVYMANVNNSYIGRNRLRSLDLVAILPNTAQNNVVEGNAFFSAYDVADDGGRLEVFGCNATGNRIENNTIDTLDKQQPAVLFTFGANANSFNYNSVHGSVQLQNAPRNTMRGNFISSESDYAVFLESLTAKFPCGKNGALAQGNVVTDNDIEGGSNGILLGEPRRVNGYNDVVGNLVGGNRISNVPGAGLFFNLSARSNDGRNNTYSNVGTLVADHIGSRNLWP